MLDMAKPQGAVARECINGSSEEEMMEWQPIETAPKTGDMLLWDDFSIHIGKYYPEYECFYAYDIAPPMCWPTHWMPLPEPPK